jgi:hypothetical protein
MRFELSDIFSISLGFFHAISVLLAFMIFVRSDHIIKQGALYLALALSCGFVTRIVILLTGLNFKGLETVQFGVMALNNFFIFLLIWWFAKPKIK